MTITTDLKHIEYSRLDHDYSAFYAGEFIGAYPTYHAAELALDDHALYLLESGLDRTATELDGGAIDLEQIAATRASTLPDGHRIASDDEAGWWYHIAPSTQVWITEI